MHVGVEIKRAHCSVPPLPKRKKRDRHTTLTFGTWKQIDPRFFAKPVLAEGFEQFRTEGNWSLAKRIVTDLCPETRAVAPLAAIREWGTIPATGRYTTLKSIAQPTLIVNGNKDIVMPPINGFILAEHLPNAQLIVYPDSSHGAQYQHAKIFLEHVKLFLGR